MRIGDVFVAGGLPNITYNPRNNEKLEDEIRDYIDTGHKLLSLTGPTKSGKTVLCQRTIPDDEAIWVAGGSIDSEDDLWEEIIQNLDLYENITKNQDQSESSSAESTLKSGLNVGIAKTEGDLKEGELTSSSEGEAKTRITSKKLIAISGLIKSKKILIIDDFHYINKDIQLRIIRSLKDPIFKGIRVIIIAVPHRSYDAIKAESEMTGRVMHIGIKLWGLDELKYIGEKGFGALNTKCSDDLMVTLSHESWKSPFLMQEFCLRLCKLNEVREKQEFEKELVLDDTDSFFYQTVESIASKIAFEKLARGPTQRADRKVRKLKTGEEVDIYRAILHAIAHTGPKPEITYEELRASLRAVLESEPPQAHEVTQILSRMNNIAKEMQGEPVIDWDKEETTLYISDPFFSFYLRWAINKKR